MIGASEPVRTSAYVALGSLWAAAVGYSFRAYRRHREDEQRLVRRAQEPTLA